MASSDSVKKIKISEVDEDDDEEFIRNDKVTSIVNLLNKYKVKLWEIVNLNEIESNVKIDGLNGSLDDFLMKLSDESGLVENEVKSILVRLQKHAIKKFEANKRYTRDGIAIYSLKIIGNNNNLYPKTFKETIEIMINITGKEMKNFIKNKFQLDCDNLKLIYNGKLIKDDLTLNAQDLKNHSIIMVMCIYEKLAIESVNKNSEDYKAISDIREAVSFLAENDAKMKDEYSNELQLRNQNGVIIEMSKADQQCLTLAMVLHQKGKALVKSKEYLKALILFAEADNEFKSCSDRGLLERIDNYALLNLDIVWCYLCLQNLHDLKNAEERIHVCEKCLEKCYGSNLERLTLLQGNSNKYTPIFVRLNLLKAILNYHKGKKKECKQHLDTASEELQKITVDEEKIIQVMSMGFSSTQARLALRSTCGNVSAAIEQIIKKKDLKKKAEKLEKENRYIKRIEEKYGRTIKDAKPIDVKVLKDLIQFGYTEEKAARALAQSNNDFNLALDILQADITDDDTTDTTPVSTAKNTATLVNPDLIVQLSSMGYEVELAKLCLEAFDSNIEKSVNYLISKLSSPMSSQKEIENDLKDILKKKETSTDKPKTEASSNETLIKVEEAKKLISTDVPEDDEEYLDFNLDDDALFINKYYSLLNC